MSEVLELIINSPDTYCFLPAVGLAMVAWWYDHYVTQDEED
jgi:hypothetical protein